MQKILWGRCVSEHFAEYTNKTLEVVHESEKYKRENISNERYYEED